MAGEGVWPNRCTNPGISEDGSAHYAGLAVMRPEAHRPEANVPGAVSGATGLVR